MYKPTTAVWQPSAFFLFKLSVISIAVAGIGLTGGCSSTAALPQVQSTQTLELLDASSLDSMEDLLSATDMRAVEGDRLLILKHGDVWKRMTVGFKFDNKWDPRIDAQRSWFISRQPYIDRLSARASRYLYYTVKEQAGMSMPFSASCCIASGEVMNLISSQAASLFSHCSLMARQWSF